tara:strand:+ start:1202 stop:2128 length:927 start_codon:yes stop_codon:yes gene_type:complete
MKGYIKKLLRESLLSEVRYIDTTFTGKVKNYKPIKDSETIIVYHGFNSLKDATNILENGLHGKARAKRIYSYESGNNPYGLFVSVNFGIVKREFSSSGIIIEFSTKVSDLEAPVWVGGRSYYVQGEYTQSFKDLDDREKQRLINRQKSGESPYDYISKSDRPELASTIFENSENQALYIGDLNPNMIKSVWYNEKLHKEMLHGGTWVRYSRKDFIKMMNMKPKPEISKQKSDTSFPSFRPNDDFSMDYFKKDGELPSVGDIEYDIMLDFVNGEVDDEDLLYSGFHPKQIKQMKRLRDEGFFNQFIKQG